jgi:hypothetical protein
VNAFVGLAALGILAGCATHAHEATRITLAPVAAGSVTPVRGELWQPGGPSNLIVPNVQPCELDPSWCEKQSCAGQP